VHRDTSIWGADASDFKPERWLPILSGEEKQAPYTFLPFSAGVRVCPGMQLALANAMYYLARFVQVFESVEGRDDRGWKDELKITCPNANGVHIAVTRATDDKASGLDGKEVKLAVAAVDEEEDDKE